MARRKTVKAKGIPKRWGSDNIQAKQKTRHATAKIAWRENHVMNRSQAQKSMGHVDPDLEFNHLHETIRELPPTRFSLADIISRPNLPMSDVLLKLQIINILKQDGTGGFVTDKVQVHHNKNVDVRADAFPSKKQDNFAKAYHVPTVAIRPQDVLGEGRFQVVEKYHYTKVYKLPTEELRLYCSGNNYYYILIQLSQVKRSIKYVGRASAQRALQFDLIHWIETYKGK